MARWRSRRILASCVSLQSGSALVRFRSSGGTQSASGRYGPGIRAAESPSTKTWSNSRPRAPSMLITCTAGAVGTPPASSSRSPDSATAAR
jgi:hypothetical protein